MNTNSLLNESAGFNKKMADEAKGLVAKWEKTGLLEGVTAEFERAGIATLLENQAKQLVSEALLLVLLQTLKSGPVSLFHWYEEFSAKSLLKNSFQYNL